MQADRAYAVARNVLDQLEAILTADASLPAIPERRYVAIGLPALDCAQLVVSIDRITGHEGNPAVETNNPVRCLTMRAVELSVWLLRCVPVVDDDGNPPEPLDIEASSAEIAMDPIRVLDAILAAYQAGDLGHLWGLVFLDWRSLTPQGGLAGGQQRLRIDLTAPV